MALSTKTKTVIASTLVQEKDITVYPDRTVNATLTTSATTVMRLVGVPVTSDDMNKLFEWEFGDDVKGTHANAHVGMQNYRKDINKAFGKQKDYKDFYVDTFKPVGPQLKNQ